MNLPLVRNVPPKNTELRTAMIEAGVIRPIVGVLMSHYRGSQGSATCLLDAIARREKVHHFTAEADGIRSRKILSNLGISQLPWLSSAGGVDIDRQSPSDAKPREPRRARY